MQDAPTGFWGKIRRNEDTKVVTEWLPLIDHCVDVAACFEALLTVPSIERRTKTILQLDQCRPIPVSILSRLSVIAFLHDIGKLCPSFQMQAFGGGHPGHSAQAAILFPHSIQHPDAVDGIFAQYYRKRMKRWFGDSAQLRNLLLASWAHHGRPVFATNNHAGDWVHLSKNSSCLDPVEGLKALSGEIRTLFPEAFEEENLCFNIPPAFQSLFCGLVSLADWIGSSEAFPFSPPIDGNRLVWSRGIASKLIQDLGLSGGSFRPHLGIDPIDFKRILPIDKACPNPMQAALGKLGLPPPPSDKPLKSTSRTVLLESETGSGKTEAALWYGLRLYQQGLIDGVYFALPTRTSSVQIHARIVAMVKHAFGATTAENQDRAPGVVLAVPGYIREGDHQGILSDAWKVLWDDDASPDASPATYWKRWAAENSKKFMTAPIAVGTIDQALRAILMNKHAHLRLASLSRSLLIVDEVHASDPYMRQLLKDLIKAHKQGGGHTLLMSATLSGEAAADIFDIPKNSDLSFEKAISVPYPLIQVNNARHPPKSHSIKSSSLKKAVKFGISDTIDHPEAIAASAMDAAENGCKVLVIRNSVAGCLDVFQALKNLNKNHLIFSINNIPTVHHGRFSPNDRILLDQEVEKQYGKQSRSADAGGKILVATQTVEQSLDIDADLLITDLVPMDVLLQRVGRLHRHQNKRPKMAETATCIVLTHKQDLIILVEKNSKPRMPAHGLGIGRPYPDIRIAALTLQSIKDKPDVIIPDDNRWLIENSMHSTKISELESKHAQWKVLKNEIFGLNTAQKNIALLNTLDVTKEFDTMRFPEANEQRIATRLGIDGITIQFDKNTISPFTGTAMEMLHVPYWMMPKDDTNRNEQGKGSDIIATVFSENQIEKSFSFKTGTACYSYGPRGLEKIQAIKEDKTLNRNPT